MHASSWLGGQLAELSVLVVSVPNPQPRGAAIYELLPEADAETDAIVDSLTSIKGVKPTLLKGKDATFDNVWGALKANSYQILHFNGHASFNEDQPQSSGLVLYDRDMTTGALTSFLSKGPPVFCFVNACETSKVTLWEDRYNIYGVAQAILQTGSYLLGSRWKLTDTAAAAFAGKFYEAWLGGGKSLGEAIRDARLECRKGASPDDLAWASYVFYGDPRVYFRNTG
jgi:CHAT domain-containing protein